jgi:hypothetical protein
MSMRERSVAGTDHQDGMVGLCPLPGSCLDIGVGPSTRPGGSSGAPAEGGGTGSLGGRDG